MEIQRTIGADIIMAFDECTPYPCDYRYAQRSMHMTHRWLDRCIHHLEKLPFKYGFEQTFFQLFKAVPTKIYEYNRQNILPIQTNKEMLLGDFLLANLPKKCMP